MNILQSIYYAAFKWKKRRARRRRLSHPVISVGNITVGGTGKTPAVIALAREAQRRGLHPAILTRGYRGTLKGPCFISKGDGPIVSAFEGGDEPVLMAGKLPGVEIIKGDDRYEAGLLSKHGDLFILDDGFQHWRLHRDVDIVLIDTVNPFGNGGLLPTGRLREAVGSLDRADFIVMTRAASPSKERAAGFKIDGIPIPQPASSEFIYGAVHEPSHLAGLDGSTFPLLHMSGKRVTAFSAIGNPEGFHRTLASLGVEGGVEGVNTMRFRDHHFYTKTDAENILKSAAGHKSDLIITTEKDMAKLPDAMQGVLALCIDFIIDKDFYDEVFRQAVSRPS